MWVSAKESVVTMWSRFISTGSARYFAMLSVVSLYRFVAVRLPAACSIARVDASVGAGFPMMYTLGAESYPAEKGVVIPPSVFRESLKVRVDLSNLRVCTGDGYAVAVDWRRCAPNKVITFVSSEDKECIL